MTTTSVEPETSPPDHLTRRRALIIGGVVATGAVVGTGLYLANRDRRATRLVAAYQAGELPSADPLAEIWRRRDPFEVQLFPQQMTPPYVAALAIARLLVRAMHNGREIAFHLEWEDAAKDEVEAVHRFRDAVAVQLPVDEGPPPVITMGQPDKPVHILHWKASWQADLDRGRLGVRDVFPNAYNDVFPEALLEEATAAVYAVGSYVGNPLSARERTSPFDELSDVGFGSLTHQDAQRAVGRGVFADGTWQVALGFPMQGSTTQATLRPGSERMVAFAAWNGGAGNRGGRKQWANWTPLHIDEVPG